MRKLTLFLMLATAVSAGAAITPIGPFSGAYQESWEKFQNYFNDPDFYMDDPTACMGGIASISNNVMVIYEPAAGATFGLGNYGSAQVVDGVKGHGVNAGFPAVTATLQFSTPIIDFGGYWGAADVYGNPTVPIEFKFYDANNNLIGSDTVQYGDSSGSGKLAWFGWNSSTPVSKITYTGDFVVNDYLQANIPEPASLLLLGLGVLALRRR